MILYFKRRFSDFKKLILIAFTTSLCLNVMISDGIAARKETVSGEYCYQYGDDEALTKAKEKTKKMAMKRALESAMVYVSSDIKLNATGLESMDVHSLTLGCLEDVKILEERIRGREICYRIQAVADVSLLEDKLQNIIRSAVIKPDKKIRISFYHASIDEGQSCSQDDTSHAPDSYVLVKDEHGNDVFRSGHFFLNNKKYGRLFKNRNNYGPDFDGAYFSYVFNKTSYLLVQLYDWDGIEGLLGASKSPDDPIGEPYRVDIGQPLGKRWVEGKGWKLEMEILESE